MFYIKIILFQERQSWLLRRMNSSIIIARDYNSCFSYNGSCDIIISKLYTPPNSIRVLHTHCSLNIKIDKQWTREGEKNKKLHVVDNWKIVNNYCARSMVYLYYLYVGARAAARRAHKNTCGGNYYWIFPAVFHYIILAESRPFHSVYIVQVHHCDPFTCCIVVVVVL